MTSKGCLQPSKSTYPIEVSEVYTYKYIPIGSLVKQLYCFLEDHELQSRDEFEGALCGKISDSY